MLLIVIQIQQDFVRNISETNVTSDLKENPPWTDQNELSLPSVDPMGELIDSILKANRLVNKCSPM